MVKIILHSIGNDEKVNYYIFDKKQIVADYLSILFHDIFGIYWEFDELNDNGKSRKISIEKRKDVHEGLTCGSDTRVDVFYGDKKMFISIHCNQKLRLRFNEELEKISVMSKPIKLKKISKKN